MSKALDLVARLKARAAQGELGTPAPQPVHGVMPVSAAEPGAWDEETLERIAWLQGWDPPSQPFVLAADPLTNKPCVTVALPQAFKQGLLRDLAAGPAGPRSRTGALQSDLARISGMFRRS